MPSPPLLFFDSDCLIQIFMVNQVLLLKWLKAQYGVQPVIVPEVYSELSWNGRFKDRFDRPLRKAISAGVLSVFEYFRPEQMPKHLSVPQATIMAKAITDTGREYNLIVDLGEAYSHAACVHLGVPLLTQDQNAVRTLLEQGKPIAVPVLRVFDLLALAFRRHGISEKACDTVRQLLNQSAEFLPPAFRNASFINGIKMFDARLYDESESTEPPTPCLKFNDPLFLSS